MAVGLVAVVAALTAAGVPTRLAIVLAFVVVGLTTMVVERRLGREAPVFGAALLLLGGVAGVGVLLMAVAQAGVGGRIVGVVATVVVLGMITGGVALYRALAARTNVAQRRRMALRRGWRYARQAEVAVPGPRSARRLKGVPNNATTTTGRDVVWATANGLPVTMFDRVRPNEKRARVQSVWLVHLPAALQYLPFPPCPDERTDSDVAQALLTPQVRAGAARVARTLWLEGAYLCAVDDSDGRRGTPAREIERTIEAVTALAAQLPWQTIAPYVEG